MFLIKWINKYTWVIASRVKVVSSCAYHRQQQTQLSIGIQIHLTHKSPSAYLSHLSELFREEFRMQKYERKIESDLYHEWAVILSF